MWQVSILTLFPEIFPGPLTYSVTGNAIRDEHCSITTHNIRDYALDKYRTVDNPPYGGGSGMVLRPDVMANAIDNCFIPNGFPIFYLSPRGKTFTQKIAHDISSLPGANFICGRFEGIDERIFLEYNVKELSLGDFVLTSGDVALIPILDACIRLLPNVLEDKQSVQEESFGIGLGYENLLEYPHYTKPAEWKGHKIPDVLLSGHHANIAKWRLEQAKLKTKVVRPDLIRTNAL